MSGTIEEFDDDTDFALPTAPAAVPPAGGMSMDNLQQMMAQMQAGGGAGPSGAGGMPPGMQQMMGMGGVAAPPAVELSSEEKKWVTIYPIYFDAKRRYEKGCRRVAYKESCLWPKSENLVKAVSKLTLYHVHEPRKAHPRDWENPGRIKVQLFNDEGNPLHQKYTNKKELLRAIAEIIQPDCGGVPPPLPAHPKKVAQKSATTKTSDETQKAVASTSKKSSAKAGETSKNVVKTTTQQQPYKNAAAKESKPRHRVPIRVDSQDRIKAANKVKATRKVQNGRLPAFSPIKSAGVLNADFGKMMGGLPGMGPMGSMLGALGMGGDDDDDEEETDEAKAAEEKKAKDPLKNLSRRQRKRVVRVGR